MSQRKISKYFKSQTPPNLNDLSQQAPISSSINHFPLLSERIDTKDLRLTQQNGNTQLIKPNNDNNNNINSPSTLSIAHNYKNTPIKKALSESGDEKSPPAQNIKKLKTRDQTTEGVSEVKQVIKSEPKSSITLVKGTPGANGNLTAINAIADANLICYEKPRMLTRLAKKLMEQSVSGAGEVVNATSSKVQTVSGSTLTGSRTAPTAIKQEIKNESSSEVTAVTNGQRNVARKSLPKALPSAGGGQTLVSSQNAAAKQSKAPVKSRSTTPRAKGRPKTEIVFAEVSSSPSASSSNGISLSSLGSGGASAMPAEFSTPEYVRERLEMVPFQAPRDWQRVLANTKQMRFNAGNAPVDDFGPMRWMLHSVNSDELDDIQLNLCRFRVIVCLILSIRGRDKTVNSVMEALGGESITPQSILSMPHSMLLEKIRPVGLQETKANYLRQTSRLIIEKYNMISPNNMEDLYALPGIDNKCGVLALHIGFNKDAGIAVDTHVHRIANRLGWANSNSPSKTMMQLQDWMPREEWGSLNYLLVGFGQLICTAKNPSCQSCLNSTICPFGRERLRNLDF